MCVNNVDIASSRAFTGGVARKPLPAAMRIPLGINGFPFYPRIIGSRPLHDADARRNTGTHACAHPYRRTTTTMKKSDTKYFERECDPRGYGFRGEGAPTRGGGVVDARAALRNKRLISRKDFTVGWDDEIKAEQRAASDQTAELQRRRIASCRRYADVIDKAAPDIARACGTWVSKAKALNGL